MTPPVRWRLDKAKVRARRKTDRTSPVTDQHQRKHHDECQDEEGDKA